MPQRLRAMTNFAEEPWALFPPLNMVAHKHLLTPLPSTDMHVAHRHTCRQNIDKNKSYNYSFE